MRRRRALSGVGSAAALALAGCAGGDNTATEARSVTVTLENRDDRERDYVVAIQDGDGGTVTRTEGTLQPAGIQDEPTTLVSRGAFENGPYTVRVSTDDGESSHNWTAVDCALVTVAATVRSGSPTLDATCE